MEELSWPMNLRNEPTSSLPCPTHRYGSLRLAVSWLSDGTNHLINGLTCKSASVFPSRSCSSQSCYLPRASGHRTQPGHFFRDTRSRRTFGWQCTLSLGTTGTHIVRLKIFFGPIDSFVTHFFFPCDGRLLLGFERKVHNACTPTEQRPIGTIFRNPLLFLDLSLLLQCAAAQGCHKLRARTHAKNSISCGGILLLLFYSIHGNLDHLSLPRLFLRGPKYGLYHWFGLLRDLLHR